MGLIIKLLVFLIFLTILRLFFRKLFGPVRSRSSHRASTASGGPKRVVTGKTVKDPYCGMYIAKNLAIATQVKKETLYFCSEQCRDSYVRTFDQTGKRERAGIGS